MYVCNFASNSIVDQFLSYNFAFYIFSIRRVVFEKNVPEKSESCPIETHTKNRVCGRRSEANILRFSPPLNHDKQKMPTSSDSQIWYCQKV